MLCQKEQGKTWRAGLALITVDQNGSAGIVLRPGKGEKPLECFGFE
jgi:hypothetical protein